MNIKYKTAALIATIMFPAGFAILNNIWGLSDERKQLKDEKYGKRLPDELVESLATSLPSGVRSAYKTLESAAMVLRIARAGDSRLSNPNLDLFFDKLLSLQRLNWATVTFRNKIVIVLEGLAGSGKTTLGNALGDRIPNSAIMLTLPEPILQARNMFLEMPEPIIRAFDYVTCYFIANEISESTASVIIVESYYHAVCANITCEDTVTLTDLQSLPPSAFYWPIDLPQPSLVYFLNEI